MIEDGMRKLSIGILDLVCSGPTKALYARAMNANLAGIMPSVIAAWCAEAGHDVRMIAYTGSEDLRKELPAGVDIVFIAAFTETALLAYSLSNLFRSRGAVTVLGGPHARCYPQDAQNYFDFVLGFTDKEILRQVLEDRSPHHPGIRLSAAKQPTSLASLRQRWPYIAPTRRKAPVLKMVPMIASLGCPYTCPFCIDSTVTYQELGFDALKEDLRFLLEMVERPVVGWHDPNFGVLFDQTMDAIEEAVPPGRITFVAESSLSILPERRLERLRRNGFKGLLPGVESWFDVGNKSKSAGTQGMEKVRQVSEHINTILRYVPYLQANFVLGLDSNEGEEPFELTKRFLEMSPGAFPGFSLLSAFGQAAPLNLGYQRAGRVLAFPFHFLDNHSAMNVVPKNYSWPEFYRLQIDLTRHAFSGRRILARFRANRGVIPKGLNVIRGISTEGWGRIRYFSEIRRLLLGDRAFRDFFERETTDIPTFYIERIRGDLGDLWPWLPAGALRHDPAAYLKETRQASRIETAGSDNLPMAAGAKPAS